jgi:F0F1-type ATP synthase assembly protein I
MIGEHLQEPDEPKEGDAWGDTPDEAPVATLPFTPESTEEGVRKSGLAWSAGIVFFGAIVFMLFLGWGADLLMGSSPWGIVGGIVLGSVIGFIQFFRITSQIFGPKKAPPETRPLMERDQDDD